MVRRGLAPLTISGAVGRLWCFARGIDPKPLGEAETADVESFLDARTLSARTRYGWISRLHCFYEWAQIEGHVTADPTLRVVRPRVRKKLPRPAATADIYVAMQMADARMRCWLALMAYQGLRCQEVAGIEREDVLDTADPPMLFVRCGKGGKERMEPLHPDVAMLLRALPMPRVGRLWPSSPKYVSMRTNAFLRSLDIDATAHQLRHWFGTTTYRQCRDIRLVQALMGHDSIQTTWQYIEVAMAEAGPVVESLSVRPSMARHPTALGTLGLGSAHGDQVADDRGGGDADGVRQ